MAIKDNWYKISQDSDNTSLDLADTNMSLYCRGVLLDFFLRLSGLNINSYKQFIQSVLKRFV